MTLVNDYSQMMFSMSLEDLVEQYFDFEQRVRNDVLALTLEYFKKEADNFYGDTFIINKRAIHISFPTASSDRHLTVFLTIDDVRAQAQPISQQLEISHIGLIRHVKFIYPRGFSKQIGRLLKLLKELLDEAYLSLESSFRSKYKQYENRIIHNIYERIELEVRLRLQERLLKKFWVSITKINGYGTPEENALVFFNNDTLDEAIRIFKADQSELYSPFELLCSLMFEEVPDEGLEQFNQDVKDVRLEFSKMTKNLQGYMRFWNAEKILLPEKSLRSLYISRQQNYILCVNYVESMAAEFKELLTPITPTLDELFKSNLNKNKLMFGLLKKTKKSSGKNWASVSDFVANLLAKYLAEVTKAA